MATQCAVVGGLLERVRRLSALLQHDRDHGLQRLAHHARGAGRHEPTQLGPDPAAQHRLGGVRAADHRGGFGSRSRRASCRAGPGNATAYPAAGIGATKPDADALMRRIAAELQVETSISPWNGVGLLRLSAQLYNCPADYE